MPFQVPIGQLVGIRINISTPSSQLEFDTDESYSLTIPLPEKEGGRTIGQINANNVFGAMRVRDLNSNKQGIETFSQLVDWSGFSIDTFNVSFAPIEIFDCPRFPWRGLLIDSSRHFFSVAFVKRILDSMEFNKLNVLHWHLIDAESFPIMSTTRPELHEQVHQ